MYPYTVTDDRLRRNKKRKDNGKRIFPDEIVLGNLVIMRFFVHLCSEDSEDLKDLEVKLLLSEVGKRQRE